MKYYLYTLFIMLIIGRANCAYAVEGRDISISFYVQQDTLSNAKRPVKRVLGKDKKSKKEILLQTENILKNVPKAKNKAIPRTIIPTSINIKSPRINPIKVKVNTQVKIKL